MSAVEIISELPKLTQEELRQVKAKLEELESPVRAQNAWEALAPVFGTVAHQDIVEMQTAIEEAFGRVDPDAWR